VGVASRAPGAYWGQWIAYRRAADDRFGRAVATPFIVGPFQEGAPMETPRRCIIPAPTPPADP
jgi:hypothetical protein